MKKISLLILTFFCAVGMAIGQKTVSGVVTDTGGEALIGANVYVENTTVGTITDIDGSFSLDVPEGTDVLTVSYTGYQTQEIDISGGNNFDIVLSEGQQLDEIVVTALGLERKKDDDLSSSTLIKTEQLTRSGESGVIQGMAGKTSGVSITQSAGDPGAGAHIQIRGQNTILGSGSPLIVVDGVPVSNSNLGSGTAGVVQQSRFNDIPASDIESVTVLKGASAAAIYGSGAANGVIIVKTKRGRTGGKKMSVEFNASLGVDQVNVEHEKQGVFGQGSGGSYNPTHPLSFGDKIADRAGGADEVDESGRYFVSDQTGKKYYPVTTKNSKDVFNATNRDAVFRDGLTQNYSIGLSYAGDDGSNTYIGYSRLDQVGVIRGKSNYDRNTFRINHTRPFSDWLTGRINASYAKVSSERVQTGSNLNGLYLGYLRTSPDFDNRDYSGTYYTSQDDKVGRANSHRSYRRRHLGEAPAIYNNPGWTTNKVDNPNDVDRFILSPELNFKLSDGLNLTARYGMDFYQDDRYTHMPAFSASEGANGFYLKNDYSERIQDFNVFLNGNLGLAENVGMNWIVGYQLHHEVFNRITTTTSNFLNRDPSKILINNATSDNISAEEYNSVNAKNGAYAQVQFDLLSGLLFEASGRLERSATVPDKLNFYPSVSAGYVLTDKPQGALSFAKFRASYGEVGIEPSLYRNKNIFSVSRAGEPGWGDVLNGSNYGGTTQRGAVQGNPDLNVERVKEFEIGGDFRFLDNKLRTGITYFNRRTVDAILDLDVPTSTGFSSVYRNAAEISNKGIEVDLSYNILSNNALSWDVFGNFTSFKNIVESLPDVDYYFLDGFTSTSSGLLEGQPFGAIYGGVWDRDDSGKLILSEDGFPSLASQKEVVGDPNSDYRAGIGSALSYKGLNFSFQFETSQGNDMWGGTQGVLKYFGIHPETAVETTATQDLKNLKGETIPAGTTFRGSIGDFGGGPVALDQSWYNSVGGGFGGVSEQFVTDASWTKLRQVSLSYALPVSMLGNSAIREVEVGVTGRNLLLWTDFKGVDPEVNLTGASKGRGLDYFTNPGTKSYVFNVRLKF